jgi:hypothetical protein
LSGAVLDETFAEALVHRQPPAHLRFLSSLVTRHSSLAAWSGHCILGIRLRPFSFWHAACLDFIKSPFAGHADGLPTLDTLLWAVAACRTRFPQIPSLEGFSGRLLRYRAIFNYARGQRLARADHKTTGQRDNGTKRVSGQWSVVSGRVLAEQLLAFVSYMADYNAAPVYGEQEDSEPVKTPWYLFAVAMQLRLNPGLSETQAWNATVGYTAWKNAAQCEAAGIKIDILTPELRQAFAKVGVKV